MRPKLKARVVVAVRLALGVVSVNQHDLSIRSASQCSRLTIDRVPKRLDCSPDALARLGSYVLDVVEHPRNRDPRNAGFSGNIVDRRVSPAHAHRLASDPSVSNG